VEGAGGAVAAAGAVEDEAAKKVRRGGAVWRGVAGEAEAAEVEGEGALFGEAEGFAEWAGIAAAAAEGLGGGGKGEVAPAFAGVGLAGPGEGADGLDDFVGGGVARLEVTNFGKKEGGGGKGIPAPRGSGGRGDGNQAGGVVAEERAGWAGFGKDPAEVGVAGAVADIEEDGAGKGGGAVGGGGDLGPEDGMEAGFPGGEEEVNGGVEVGVGEADGGEVEFGRSGHNGLDRKEGVVKAVVGADVEGGVGGHEVLYKCIMIETARTEFKEGGFFVNVNVKGGG
jgi:hypothetical protein